MASERTQPPRAVLIDALGTLLELEPPAPRLRASLARRFGVAIEPEAAERAFLAEIAFYRAHHLEGGDHAGLAALRRRCAEVVRRELPALAGAGLSELTEAVVESIVFRPYPDAAAALTALRDGGIRTVVVSNWDVSLHGVLARTGLAGLVNGAISSAELGVRKPDPSIFGHALTLAGIPREHAVHVGDSPREDAEGALAARLGAVLLDRHGGLAAPPGVPVIRTLAELPALVGAGTGAPG